MLQESSFSPTLVCTPLTMFFGLSCLSFRPSYFMQFLSVQVLQCCILSDRCVPQGGELGGKNSYFPNNREIHHKYINLSSGYISHMLTQQLFSFSVLNICPPLSVLCLSSPQVAESNSSLAFALSPFISFSSETLYYCINGALN